MKSSKSLFIAALISASMLPLAAQAQVSGMASGMSGVMNHGSEIGIVNHDDYKSSKSRDTVKAELDVAHNNGTHEMGNDASTVKQSATGVGKSRATVQGELARMSAQEKKYLESLYSGAM